MIDANASCIILDLCKRESSLAFWDDSGQSIGLLHIYRALRGEDMDSYHVLGLARLRSHELHLAYIYRLRWGGLALAALTICIGAAMILQAFRAPLIGPFKLRTQ